MEPLAEKRTHLQKICELLTLFAPGTQRMDQWGRVSRLETLGKKQSPGFEIQRYHFNPQWPCLHTILNKIDAISIWLSLKLKYISSKKDKAYVQNTGVSAICRETKRH